MNMTTDEQTTLNLFTRGFAMVLMKIFNTSLSLTYSYCITKVYFMKIYKNNINNLNRFTWSFFEWIIGHVSKKVVSKCLYT